MIGISVVTICFNNPDDLKKTIASVDAQESLPAEHWIINGSTRPDIAQWLEEHPQPSYRKWINEPDKGISDAFNKGLQRATQPFTHLLNAGDTYADAQVLADVGRFLEEDPEADWISGRIMTTRGGVPVTIGKPFDPKKLYRGMRSVSHPSWFVRRTVYDQTGFFELKEKIAMDYDLLCRLSGYRYRFLPRVITWFDPAGTSNQHYLQSLQDTIRIYESYHSFSIRCRLWQGRLRLLYHLLQTRPGKWLMGWKKRLGWENI